MTLKEYIKANYPNADASELLEELKSWDSFNIQDKNVLQLTLSELVDLAGMLEVHITVLVLDLV